MDTLLLGPLSSQSLFYCLILLANVSVHQYHSLFYHRKCSQLSRNDRWNAIRETVLNIVTQFFMMIFLWSFIAYKRLHFLDRQKKMSILIHCYDPSSQCFTLPPKGAGGDSGKKEHFHNTSYGPQTSFLLILNIIEGLQ